MKKKSEFGLSAFFPECFCDQHEVVVVHPDLFSVPGEVEEHRGKGLIYLPVGTPVAFLEDTATHHVMKKRPDGLVGKTAVVARYFALCHGNRLQRIAPFLACRRKCILHFRRHATRVPAPAYPVAPPFSENRIKSTDQAAV